LIKFSQRKPSQLLSANFLHNDSRRRTTAIANNRRAVLAVLQLVQQGN
jgi:hypothetical protein